MEFVKEEAKAKEYVARMEKAVDEKFIQREAVLATKLDIAALKTDLAETKSDNVKWMFLFWVGAVVATLGSLIAIVRFIVAI